MLRSSTFAAIALALGLAASPAGADNALHGRFELSALRAAAPATSLDAFLGTASHSDIGTNLRLTWQPNWGNWDFSLHYVLRGTTGEGVSLDRAKAAMLPPAPPATLFDLSDTITDAGNRQLTQTIDRLSLGYSTPNFVFRIGRQALTWGSGQVFHPMDLVDPFAPNAVDTEYKPGVDMAYAQFLFDDGSDLQAVAAPRPARRGGPATDGASTYALHYNRFSGALGTALLLARDRGDWTLGLGLSGPLGGASWNAEIVPTFEAGGAVKTSALLNISLAGALAGRNATFFGEYFHNGFGVAKQGTALDALPADLTARLVRGQLFTTSRNYLAGGMSLEMTPLLTLSPSIIANLDDGSYYASLQGNLSITDNTALVFGAQGPFGPRRTEFGGLPVSGNTAPYASEPSTAFLQLRHYF